jgi:type VI secretion system secreted protein VgrG
VLFKFSNFKKEGTHMRTGTSYFKTFSKMTWLFALLLVVFSAGCDRQSAEGVIVLVDAGPAGSVSLGTASTYGIMATNAISYSGTGALATVIYGDVALNPGTSISGFTGAPFPVGASTSSQVAGTIHIDDAVAIQAQADLLAAYNDLSTRPAPATVLTNPTSAVGVNGGTFTAGAVDLTGYVLLPGIYSVGNPGADSFALTNTNGPLVLDGGGNSGAVFIFQAYVMSTTNGSVVLRNGARATNVYWVVTTAATIGNGSNGFWQGTVLAGGTIVVNQHAQGRMLAGALGAGALTISGNDVISVPAP